MKKKNLSTLSLVGFSIFLVVFAFSVKIFVLAQINDREIVTDEKIDKIDVLYAVEGKLVNDIGKEENFIFGIVKIHKTFLLNGALKDKWSGPTTYFEMKNDKTIALTLNYDFFHEIKMVKEFSGSFSRFNFANYNHEDISGEEANSYIFELDFIFTEDGKIDIENSSVGIIPSQYEHGRDIKIYGPTGNFYKKGSETELFVPILDENKKIINTDEMGDPVFDFITVHVENICYDKLTFDTTNLCSMYRIKNISNSTGPLLDGYKLGVMGDI